MNREQRKKKKKNAAVHFTRHTESELTINL